MMYSSVHKAVMDMRRLMASLAGAMSLAGCMHAPGTQGVAQPSANADVHRASPGVNRPPVHGRQAARTMPLSPHPRRYGPFENLVFEYRDRALATGDERIAAQALAAFLKGPARCVNRVQRHLQGEGAIELTIGQRDPFSGTQFVFRCRGACNGVLFRVEAGFPSEYETQDGSFAGYPLISISPPRMAQNRDQGVVVWRAPGSAGGPAIVDLLQVSRNPFAYGGGCQ